VNRHVDLIAEAGERFVDRVVDDFVDEMMQPGRPRRSDVHRGTLANRLEALENLDLVGVVVVRADTIAVVAGRNVRRQRLRLVTILSVGVLHQLPALSLTLASKARAPSRVTRSSA